MTRISNASNKIDLNKKPGIPGIYPTYALTGYQSFFCYWKKFYRICTDIYSSGHLESDEWLLNIKNVIKIDPFLVLSLKNFSGEYFQVLLVLTVYFNGFCIQIYVSLHQMVEFWRMYEPFKYTNDPLCLKFGLFVDNSTYSEFILRFLWHSDWTQSSCQGFCVERL